MPALCVATNVEELYHTVLVETPLGEHILVAFLSPIPLSTPFLLLLAAFSTILSQLLPRLRDRGGPR